MVKFNYDNNVNGYVMCYMFYFIIIFVDIVFEDMWKLFYGKIVL